MVAPPTARPYGAPDLPWATPESCSLGPQGASNPTSLIPRSPARSGRVCSPYPPQTERKRHPRRQPQRGLTIAFRRNDRGSAMPATVTSALTVPSFGALLDSFRLSSNRHWQVFGVLATSLPVPAAESIRSARISDLCAPFPRSNTRQDRTSPREVQRGRIPLFSRCSLRVSGTLWES